MKSDSISSETAMILSLMKIYSRHFYLMSFLEIQKLSYFLQESGQSLRLDFIKHLYGPYAHNISKVVNLLEGHYIQEYEDTAGIRLTPHAIKAVDDYIGNNADEKVRIDRIASLMDGFETPYGMELLASVHWVVAHDHISADKADTVIASIKEWDDRKARTFKDKHICIALDRLKSEGWLNVSME